MGMRKEEEMEADRGVSQGREEVTITREEIERAVIRLKKKKAAGKDGIRNEAWINADKKTE